MRQQLRSQGRLLRLRLRLLFGRAIQVGLGTGPLRVVLAFQTIGFVLRRSHPGVVLVLQPVRFVLGGGHACFIVALRAVRFVLRGKPRRVRVLGDARGVGLCLGALAFG